MKNVEITEQVTWHDYKKTELQYYIQDINA